MKGNKLNARLPIVPSSSWQPAKQDNKRFSVSFTVVENRFCVLLFDQTF